MDERSGLDNHSRRAAREPIFDLPGVLVGLVGLLLAVHVLRGFLSLEADDELLLLFAFIPARYLPMVGWPIYPGGWGAVVWTFLSHAVLHGSWPHLLFNSAMLAAVGRPVALRLGALRFLVLVIASAAAGAAAHLVVEWGSQGPMIGASGVVFGVFGAALRFIFVPAWQPLPSVRAALRIARVQRFILALVVMNLLVVVIGTAPFGGGDGEGAVAWAAHLGGFLVGFFAYESFERLWRS
jgi:membrane associated rhomboid family serine protease